MTKIPKRVRDYFETGNRIVAMFIPVITHIASQRVTVTAISSSGPVRNNWLGETRVSPINIIILIS